MTNPFNFNPDEYAGWEQIWRSDDIPLRFQTFAAPNNTVVEWIETVPSAGSVLDVGCGVGRHVLYLAVRGFQVAGMDISPSGIRLAQEAAAARQLTFDGKVGDMTSLPWADETFDAALSTSTIHHQMRSGIVQTLAEVRRVLKPGGLFLVDFPCTDTITYQELRQQVTAGEMTEVEPDTFVDEGPMKADDDLFLPHHFCDEAEVRALLHDFELIRLWADLREVVSESGSGKVGKWVAWVRRPFTD